MWRPVLLSMKPSYCVKHRGRVLSYSASHISHSKCHLPFRTCGRYSWSKLHLSRQLLRDHRWTTSENCASHKKMVLFLLSLLSEMQNDRTWSDLDYVSRLNSCFPTELGKVVMTWFSNFSREVYSFQWPSTIIAAFHIQHLATLGSHKALLNVGIPLAWDAMSLLRIT